jgi:hypothetical protein
MASTSEEHEGSRRDDLSRSDEATEASDPTSTNRSIAISSAAVYGALLSGLVAFLQGSAAVAAFGLRLERVGFFRNWLIEAVFAGRSVVAVVLITLAGAALGAGMWSAGALVLNRIVASPTNGIGGTAIAAWWRRHGNRHLLHLRGRHP